MHKIVSQKRQPVNKKSYILSECCIKKNDKIHYLDYNLRVYEHLYLSRPNIPTTMAQTGRVKKNVRTLQACIVLLEWQRNTK